MTQNRNRPDPIITAVSSSERCGTSCSSEHQDEPPSECPSDEDAVGQGSNAVPDSVRGDISGNTNEYGDDAANIPTPSRATVTTEARGDASALVVDSSNSPSRTSAVAGQYYLTLEFAAA